MVNRTSRTPNTHYLTAHEIRRMLDNREISAVELLESSRSRIVDLDSELNAFLRTIDEDASTAAEEADRRLRGSGSQPGPLTGVPVMVKDNMSTKGVRNHRWLTNTRWIRATV